MSNIRAPRRSSEEWMSLMNILVRQVLPQLSVLATSHISQFCL